MVLLGTMTQKEHHLQNAKHNESACEFLDTKKHEFCDWIVISAFYSALHYVSHKIFPFEESNSTTTYTINNIGDYKTYLDESRHILLKNLVFDKCVGIGTSYSRLLDMSFGARYSHQNNDRRSADSAIRYLGQIKAHCVPAV